MGSGAPDHWAEARGGGMFVHEPPVGCCLVCLTSRYGWPGHCHDIREEVVTSISLVDKGQKSSWGAPLVGLVGRPQRAAATNQGLGRPYSAGHRRYDHIQGPRGPFWMVLWAVALGWEVYLTYSSRGLRAARARGGAVIGPTQVVRGRTTSAGQKRYDHTTWDPRVPLVRIDRCVITKGLPFILAWACLGVAQGIGATTTRLGTHGSSCTVTWVCTPLGHLPFFGVGVYPLHKGVGVCRFVVLGAARRDLPFRPAHFRRLDCAWGGDTRLYR